MEKYGINDAWNLKDINHHHGTSLWKGIMHYLDLFQKGICYDLGKGDRSAFWTNIWCGNRPLKDLYPAVYFMVENQLAKDAYD